MQGLRVTKKKAIVKKKKEKKMVANFSQSIITWRGCPMHDELLEGIT